MHVVMSYLVRCSCRVCARVCVVCVGASVHVRVYARACARTRHTWLAAGPWLSSERRAGPTLAWMSLPSMSPGPCRAGPMRASYSTWMHRLVPLGYLDTCTHARMRACMQRTSKLNTQAHTRVQCNLHTYTRAYTHLHIRTGTHAHIHEHACIYAPAHTYRYTRAYTRTHMHIHAGAVGACLNPYMMQAVREWSTYP